MVDLLLNPEFFIPAIFVVSMTIELAIVWIYGMKSDRLISHFLAAKWRREPHQLFGFMFLVGHIGIPAEFDVPGITYLSGIFIASFLWDIIAAGPNWPRLSQLYVRAGFGDRWWHYAVVTVSGITSGCIVWPQGLAK